MPPKKRTTLQDYLKRHRVRPIAEREPPLGLRTPPPPPGDPFAEFTEPRSSLVIPPTSFPPAHGGPAVRLSMTPLDITTMPSTQTVWEVSVAAFQWGRILIDCLCSSASTADPIYAYVEVHEAIGALTYMTTALFVGEQSSDSTLDTGPIIHEIPEGRMPERVIVKASWSKLVATSLAAGDAGTLYCEGIFRK